MRQVPTYLVIGHGRVARHFLHYLSRLHISVLHWQRGQRDLQTLAQQATHILLLISDRAIEPFIREHLTDTAAIKIHFSGAIHTPLAFGAHPLMTFGHDLYDLDTYKKIPFIVDAGAPEDILPQLPNVQHRLDPVHKAKYHALCVMAGNFSCLLWQKLFDTMKNEFNLPPEAAQMYLKQQTENLLADYQTALTGPLARGDSETIARNLHALRGDAFMQVYQSFVTAYSRAKEKAG